MPRQDRAVVQARGTDAQPVGFAEGATGFVGVANERHDRIASRESAADDLAAARPVAPITAVVTVSPFGKLDEFKDVRSRMMARYRTSDTEPELALRKALFGLGRTNPSHFFFFELLIAHIFLLHDQALYEGHPSASCYLVRD